MSDTRIKMHPVLNILVCTDGHIMMPATQGNKFPRWTRGTTGGGSGYLRVRVRGKDYKVHRLVLETFVGMCPTGMQGDHINRNRQDNRLENLRWVTPQENNRNRRDNDRCEALLGMHWYQDAQKCYKRYSATTQGKAAIKRSQIKRKQTRKCIKFSNRKKAMVSLADYDKLIRIDISERDMDRYKEGTLFQPPIHPETLQTP